jgi:hypothetical protein
MKTSVWQDNTSKVSNHSLEKDPQPRFVWGVWCNAAIAVVIWLVLLGLALFALAVLAPPHPASFGADSTAQRFVACCPRTAPAPP